MNLCQNSIFQVDGGFISILDFFESIKGNEICSSFPQLHLKSSCDPARNSHGHKFPRLFTLQDEEKLMGRIEHRFKSNVKFLRKDCHFLSAVPQPNHFHLPQSSEFH